MKFDLISSIEVASNTEWQDHVYLTFDIDWASDEVLSFAIDLVENAGVRATWFVTHDTPVLARLRVNPLFELGIHPNFNPLLMGESDSRENCRTILCRMLEIVPEAKTIRSHSLTQSTHLLSLFSELGLTHDSNIFIPWHSEGKSVPWQNWNGLIRVPYCWEDHVAIITNCFDLDGVLSCKGLKVLDFHPVHVVLNTEKIERYVSAKPFQRDWKKLNEISNPGYGVRSSLEMLLSLGG